MRTLLFVLLSGFLVLGMGACDRLPDVGDEGQPCFDNGNCTGDLVCDTDTMICCGPGGCDSGCGSCPDGTYCEGETCLPCELIGHCGDLCTDCSTATVGLLCLMDEASEWNCGCNQDSDCLHPRTCVDGLCENLCTPQCIGKCAGEDDTCDGQCPDPCESGHWCVAGSCSACGQDADHCGQACLACSQNTTNRACISDGAMDFECGCTGIGHCDTGDCIGGFCSDCVPDCAGVCDPAEDGCGGTCPDSCDQDFCCVGGSCEPNSQAEYCGAGCNSCIGQSDGSACVQDINSSEYRCGCGSDGDCTVPMTCQMAEQLCGTDLPPEPLYRLDLSAQTCTVVDLALSAKHGPHDKEALLVGCSGGGDLERLWFLDPALLPGGVLDPAIPHASWSVGTGDNEIRSVDFRTDSYGILSAFVDNMAMEENWLHREQNAAVWSAADNMTGVSFARYSPAGDRLVVQSGFEMGSDWALYDMSFTKVGDTLTSSGYGSTVGFTADGVYAISGASAMMGPDDGGVSAVLAADGTARQDAGLGNSIETMAFPTDYNASQEFATVSQPEAGGRSLRIWTGLSENDLRAPLAIPLNDQVSAIAFLPNQNGEPSAVILGVELGRMVGFQIAGTWAGSKLSQVLTVPCVNLYQSRLRPSRDGSLLAFACGNQVQVWDVAALRGYFVPIPD